MTEHIRDPHFGFTGTRDGMTEAQGDAVRDLLAGPGWFHHGKCIGADAEAHAMAQAAGLLIWLHPAQVPRHLQANLQGDRSEESLPPLVRNHVIVDVCHVLIAAPASFSEGSGGTWSTIRYARRVGRRMLIVYPDGSVGG